MNPKATTVRATLSFPSGYLVAFAMKNFQGTLALQQNRTTTLIDFYNVDQRKQRDTL